MCNCLFNFTILVQLGSKIYHLYRDPPPDSRTGKTSLHNAALSRPAKLPPHLVSQRIPWVGTPRWASEPAPPSLFCLFTTPTTTTTSQPELSFLVHSFCPLSSFWGLHLADLGVAPALVLVTLAPQPPLPPPSRYVALLTAPRRPLPPPPRIYFLQRDLLNYNTVTENQTYTRKDKESTTWATIALRYQSPKSTMENIIQVLVPFFCWRMTASGK